ncbi:dienelactone hydrolase [Tamaricihabitans halophyticus]|uniref:Dienelactone hydrolase n=1 Tax=Tamaricihabitans halophyticus TaxID=1262583 RepID=A0A4R2QTG8_9PSEU|nr:alpha/beta hydrolase [Tamaricihabitans halophyticus]TCP53253.1 dienelactone hydrolase [Tamaricihabitans halophyticus]
MVRKAKHVLDELSHPGPHQVRRGDLALVGLPGAVYTPRSGLGLPAVAFGHGWLQPVDRYRGLLRHLASWGIVVAAPGTQRGPLPSHRLFAADLRTALDICVDVRLGEGEISVDPQRLGLAGHATGGGAAVLAAAADARVKGVATIAPTQTMPSAVEAARSCAMPGLHLVNGADLVAPAVSNADPIAQAWRGPVQVRAIDKATHLGVTEGMHWSQLLLQGKGEYRTQRLTRALFTAFFLDVLTARSDYRVLLDTDVRGTSIEQASGELTSPNR